MYTGHVITDLDQLTDRFLPALPSSPAWLIVAHARMHLANHFPITEADYEASDLLQPIQDHLLIGTPLKCWECDGTGQDDPNRPGYASCEKCHGKGRL